MEEIEEEQKEFKEKIYGEKADKVMKWAFGVLIFDLVIYAIFILIGSLDFGVIFESVALIFVIKSRKQIKENSMDSAKNSVIVAMISIGWLIIYDLIDFFCHIGQIIEEISEYYSSIDVAFYSYSIDIVDITLIIIISFLYAGYKNLCKSQGDERYKESTDWFFDKK